MTCEEAESLETSIEQLSQEVRVLRQAIDEFRVDFTHLLRNLPDNLPPPYQHLTSLAESFALEPAADHGRDVLAETLCCYECDTDSPASLSQALHDGWIDISCAEAAHGMSFVGWCPSCQRAHEEEERRINAGPVHPQGVKETGLAPEQDKSGTHPVSALRSLPAKEMQTDTATELAVESAEEESSPPANDAADGPVTNPSSEEYRNNTPLLTRLYLHRHMEGIVRLIGYDVLSRDEALARLQPLKDQYGAEAMRPAMDELLAAGMQNGQAVTRLKDDVRPLVRGIIGPPPAGAVVGTADRPTNGQIAPTPKRKNRTPDSISKVGSLRPVTLSRKEMILEFREHLEKQGSEFEQIDNVTRLNYTDKQHIGALDFIIREAGKPPELVAIRRKLTTTQLHDLSEWQAIIGDGASVSVVWLYFDSEGKTSWEVASRETGQGATEAVGD